MNFVPPRHAVLIPEQKSALARIRPPTPYEPARKPSELPGGLVGNRNQANVSRLAIMTSTNQPSNYGVRFGEVD